jgi:hypothetical protein
LLRNARWVTQKALTHPTFRISKCHSGLLVVLIPFYARRLIGRLVD